MDLSGTKRGSVLKGEMAFVLVCGVDEKSKRHEGEKVGKKNVRMASVSLWC